jgi:chemotaxis response regulator CheB
MGDDGTRGLATIAANRGTTYVQSPETCVVETMPRAAIAQNIVQRVGSPDEIGRWLLDTGRYP